MEKVVITGMGAITPVGNSAPEAWENILAGRHGIAPVAGVDMTGQKVTLAAQVKGFDPEAYMEKKDARRMDPNTRYGVAAAKQALADCGTDFSQEDPYRIGVIFGSGIGGLQTIENDHTRFVEKGPSRVPALMIPMMIPNMAAGAISIATGFKGVNYATVTACASSTHAIGEAMHAIRHGYADIMVAGGAEATVTAFALGAFSNMTALTTSKDPDRASIPFDRERDGFIMGDGGAAFILESESHARARGARIYAEVAGYGATCDAYHITSPDPEGMGAYKAMEFAVAESAAFRRLFGAGVPASSTKSMTGHMLGAAGAAEAIFTALALRDGVLPPTANYRERDPECDLDYITEGARKADIRAALSNTFGFGGHNATLCLRRWEG